MGSFTNSHLPPLSCPSSSIVKGLDGVDFDSLSVSSIAAFVYTCKLHCIGKLTYMECQSNGAPTLRPLSVDDFVQSKAKVGPSVAFDAASMNELRKWNEQYGEGGSRRKSPFGF